MRIIEGSGKNRVVTELPGLAVRARDPQEHQRFIDNLAERFRTPTEKLERKGFRVYNR